MISDDERARQILPTKALHLMAGRVTEELKMLSSWMIAGALGIVAVVLSNIDKLAPYLKVAAVAGSLKWVAAAVALSVLQRLVAAMTSSSTEVVKAIESLIEKEKVLDAEYFRLAVTKSTWWPMRLLVERSLERAETNGSIEAGFASANRAQLQAILLFAQMICVLIALVRLVP